MLRISPSILLEDRLSGLLLCIDNTSYIEDRVLVILLVDTLEKLGLV